MGRINSGKSLKDVESASESAIVAGAGGRGTGKASGTASHTVGVSVQLDSGIRIDDFDEKKMDKTSS